MFCKNCGKSIPDDAVLCPYCGTSLVANPPPQSNVPQDRKKKKKTGCLISIISVIALITIILVIAISGSDDGTTTTGDDGTSTTASSGKIETTQSKNDTAELIFEDDYIKASFIKVYSNPVVDASVEGVAYMQLHIENKSNQTVTVTLSKAAINGMTTTFGSGVPMTLLPGNASEQPFILFTKNTGVNNADDIEKLQFSFYLLDDNYSTIEETKTIEVKVK